MTDIDDGIIDFIVVNCFKERQQFHIGWPNDKLTCWELEIKMVHVFFFFFTLVLTFNHRLSVVGSKIQVYI